MRFAGAGLTVDNTEETRRKYRELLFSAAGVEQYISGVIFHDETFHQKASDGSSFVKVMYATFKQSLLYEKQINSVPDRMYTYILLISAEH